MNDAKSVLFAYIVKAKNPYIPQNSQKPAFRQHSLEIRRPFFDLDHEKWKS